MKRVTENFTVHEKYDLFSINNVKTIEQKFFLFYLKL